MNFFSLITQNLETFISLLLLLIAFVKTTAWGRAKGQALDTVVSVIESLNLEEAKSAVAAQKLNPGARDALVHAVAKSDPSKTPEQLLNRLTRELTRGLVKAPQ